jgi:hypothetical protein
MAKNDKNHTAKTQGAPDTGDDEEALVAAALAEFGQDADLKEVASGGFPPYVKPFVGAKYDFTPLWQDASNPEFVRNVCRWEADKSIMASTGPVASPEPVEVEKGGLVSISDYAGIEFLDMMGLRVRLVVTGMRPLPPGRDGKHRNPMFVFKPFLSSADAKIMEDRKAARIVGAQAQQRALAARDAEARVNSLPLTPTSAVTPAQQQLRG